jgi:hypothetical protein
VRDPLAFVLDEPGAFRDRAQRKHPTTVNGRAANGKSPGAARPPRHVVLVILHHYNLNQADRCPQSQVMTFDAWRRLVLKEGCLNKRPHGLNRKTTPAGG